MKGWLMQQALGAVLPVVVGFLVPPVMKALKSLSSRVGALSPEVQRGVVLLLASCGTALTTFLGVEITGNPTLWANAEVNAVLSSAIAYAAHAGAKAKETAAVSNAVRAEWKQRTDAGENPFTIPGA